MTLSSSPGDLLRPSDDEHVVRRTQVLDIARSVPSGVLVPLEASVLLTIAITRFDAAGWVKGLIAAASGVGLLASPFITELARRTALPAMRLAAMISVIGAAGFALAAAGPLPLLVVGSIIGVASVSAAIPLLTSTYDSNFGPLDRGKRVGRGMAVRVAAGAVAGLAMGAYLKAFPGRWWHSREGLPDIAWPGQQGLQWNPRQAATRGDSCRRHGEWHLEVRAGSAALCQ